MTALVRQSEGWGTPGWRRATKSKSEIKDAGLAAFKLFWTITYGKKCSISQSNTHIHAKPKQVLYNILIFIHLLHQCTHILYSLSFFGRGPTKFIQDPLFEKHYPEV